MKSYKFTELQLEQFLLNELPEELMLRIKSLLETDSDLKARIDELEKSGMEIFEKYPPSLVAEKIGHSIKAELNTSSGAADISTKSSPSEKINPLRGRSKRFIYSVISASAAAAAAFIIILNPGSLVDNSIFHRDTDITRIKGFKPGISLYRKTAEGSEELKDLAKVSPGDLLQISYSSTAEYRYGVIVSIDGRGAVTLHWPEDEGGSSLLKTNKKMILERSYELDDSPDFEKFILLLSHEPLDPKRVIENAKILAQDKDKTLNGTLMAGDGVNEFSITVIK